MIFRWIWSAFLAGVLGGTMSSLGAGLVSEVKSDEEILFYPSVAFNGGEGKGWEVEIHGCVYEPEKRALTVGTLKRSLRLYGLEMSAAEEKLLAERARLFMLDNEGGREVVVRLGNRAVRVGKSRANGHFSGTVRLSEEAFESLTADGKGRVRFTASLPRGDERLFAGEATVFRDTKWIVVSDVDDTIKITQVTHPQMMMRNTFLDPFRPVPGMARLYRSWEGPEVQFCYVSASPWQLFAPLSEFVVSNNFPPGVFWLKDFRLTDKSVRNLFEAPDVYKARVIEPLVKQHAASRFILVGDSGEKDPEVYGALARKYPERIHRVLIRDVTGEGRGASRMRRAFEGVPEERWEVFRKAEEVGGR